MTQWQNTAGVHGTDYVCGFCGNIVAPSFGYKYGGSNRGIFICPKCDKPTLFWDNKQTPATLLGNEVASVPEKEIYSLYQEARACTGANAFTSAVLACRKLLMHIAVEKGAPKGESFIKYVEYLADKGYIPPNGKDWVDHIRKKGNEANHEITIMEKQDALNLLTFIEMLLRFIYEFPSKIPKQPPKES